MITELRTWATVALIGLLPAPLCAQGVFESVQLAEGVWATMVKAPYSPSQYANSLLVVGRDGALLVDTRATPTTARDLVGWVRTITPLPVTRIVNSHRHSDHVYGNETLMDAYPDATLIGHTAMVEWMETDGAGQLDDDRATAAERLERWGRWLEHGETDDGTKLEPADVDELNAAMERNQNRLSELGDVRLVTPSMTVSDSLIFHDGIRTVRIMHPGPAHTSGDLVVHLPDESILWVGDLTEEGFPYFGHGTVRGWAEAMEQLDRFDALRVISSHGRSTADAVVFETQLRYWRQLTEGVGEHVQNGSSEDAAVEAVRLEAFREFFAFGSAGAAERYPQWVEDAVRAYFQERKSDAR